jgi:hypothetical protein
MVFDLSQLSTFLSAFSSVSVIVGAVFVVFQLRQNGRLLKETVRENRTNVAIALIERIRHESFAKRRKEMHHVVKKYSQNNWEGFDDSLDDFEARNFAYISELRGQLARDKIVDLSILTSALQYLVVYDWETFSPLARHLIARYKVRINPWGSFEWLANETKKYMEEKTKDFEKPASPDLPYGLQGSLD